MPTDRSLDSDAHSANRVDRPSTGRSNSNRFGPVHIEHPHLVGLAMRERMLSRESIQHMLHEEETGRSAYLVATLYRPRAEVEFVWIASWTEWRFENAFWLVGMALTSDGAVASIQLPEAEHARALIQERYQEFCISKRPATEWVAWLVDRLISEESHSQLAWTIADTPEQSAIDLHWSPRYSQQVRGCDEFSNPWLGEDRVPGWRPYSDYSLTQQRDFNFIQGREDIPADLMARFRQWNLRTREVAFTEWHTFLTALDPAVTSHPTFCDFPTADAYNDLCGGCVEKSAVAQVRRAYGAWPILSLVRNDDAISRSELHRHFSEGGSPQELVHSCMDAIARRWRGHQSIGPLVDTMEIPWKGVPLSKFVPTSVFSKGSSAIVIFASSWIAPTTQISKEADIAELVTLGDLLTSGVFVRNKAEHLLTNVGLSKNYHQLVEAVADDKHIVDDEDFWETNKRIREYACWIAENLERLAADGLLARPPKKIIEDIARLGIFGLGQYADRWSAGLEGSLALECERANVSNGFLGWWPRLTVSDIQIGSYNFAELNTSQQLAEHSVCSRYGWIYSSRCCKVNSRRIFSIERTCSGTSITAGAVSISVSHERAIHCASSSTLPGTTKGRYLSQAVDDFMKLLNQLETGLLSSDIVKTMANVTHEKKHDWPRFDSTHTMTRLPPSSTQVLIKQFMPVYIETKEAD